MIQPGAWLGVLGGGQLGRMFTIAAKQMGYFVCVLCPEKEGPASQVADKTIEAAYDDETALTELASLVEAVTIEFENIPASALKFLEALVPVRPGSHVLYVTQHRLREKTFLSELQFPVGDFFPIVSTDDLGPAAEHVGFPAVLKTAGFGYDGKGQAKVENFEQLQNAFNQLDQQTAILEAFVPFKGEISVIGVRSIQGEFSAYGPVENIHQHHILDLSICPTELLNAEFSAHAVALTHQVMDALDVVGLLCVEFFVAPDQNNQNRLLINELAPRPHNSGHYTIDACHTSQFEQQVRALCGLPLGSTQQHTPAAMAQLLGDVWFPSPSQDIQAQVAPAWNRLLVDPQAKLHLYGKPAPRPGRKMGHLTVLAETAQQAAQKARQLRAQIQALTVS